MLVTGSGHRARVRAANRAARALGIRPEVHTAARARSCAANLRVLPWDDDLIQRAQQRLAARLLEHSPAITCAGPGRFWIDAGGQQRRGGERALAHRLLASVREAGHPGARVALAGSVVAAEVAAALPNARAPLRRVPPDPEPQPGHGVDAFFLAPLPLTLLPLPADLQEDLSLLGVERIGALAGLPAASLEVRFGAPGLRARDLARGCDPRGPICQGGPRDRLVEIPLEPAAESLDPLVFSARTALVALLRAADVDGDGGGAVARLRLHLHLQAEPPRPPRPPVIREAGLGRPTRRLDPLVDRCRAVLETLTLPAPVGTLGVEILEQVSGVRGEQGDLFQARFRDPEALEAALSRIRARCGTASVVQPVPVDTHCPEAGGRWRPDPPLQAEPSPARPPPVEPPAPPEPITASFGPAPDRAAEPATGTEERREPPELREPPLPAARRVPEGPVGIQVRCSDRDSGRGPGHVPAHDPERDLERGPAAPPTALRLGRRWVELRSRSLAQRRSGAWWEAAPWDRTDFEVVTVDGARLLVSRQGETWRLLGWED